MLPRPAESHRFCRDRAHSVHGVKGCQVRGIYRSDAIELISAASVRRRISRMDREHTSTTTALRCNGQPALPISLLLIGGALLSSAPHAQIYPVKPVRLIVSQPPGGGNDTIARLISER